MLAKVVLVFAVIAVAFTAGSTTLGIVEGIGDCGSAGRLGTTQITDCTRTPCHFIPHTIYDVALRFTASLTSENLSLEVYKVPLIILMDLPIDGVIEAGLEHELAFKFPITSQYAGQAFSIQFLILDLETRFNEICAQATVTIGE